MNRTLKYYAPEERRYGVTNNLQCLYCGNSTAFYMDLRLRHQLDVRPDGLIAVELNRRLSQRVFTAIAQNIRAIIDTSKMMDREVVHCANCQDGEALDFQERLLDWCWQTGCPGCEVCGEYIPEAEVTAYCAECIHEHEGFVTEDDCHCRCPHHDDGLLGVLEHYGRTLEELIGELGY